VPAGRPSASRRRWSAWLDALHELNERDPSTPILITADQRAQQSLIRSAIEAGANEVIGAAEAAIEELVWTRVKSALAAVEGHGAAAVHPDTAHATALTGIPTTSRTAALPADGAVAGIDAVIEEPDAVLSPEARGQALTRLRDAVARMPSPEHRRGPYADLLDISTPALRAAGSGRLDAKRIAARFQVSLRQLARAVPGTHQALSDKPDSPRVQGALDPFARTAAILDELLPGKLAPQWLNTPHPRLKNRTPLQALLSGDGERVARMLEIVREGGVGG
jgi:hypothetical protein